MRLINFLLLTLIPSILFAATQGNPIAEVVKIRGEATQLSPGAHLARAVALGDKFIEDTSIVTGPKSFLKIKFIDNSELNVGPESKIVISEMKKDSVGIISLLKGRIRTEVEKDANPHGNKFFIKTRTAALGVRGTDFQTIYNPENKMTSLLTYKGEVAMAKVDEKTYQRLEDAPSKVVVRDEVTKTPEIKEVPAKKLDEVSELNKILNSKSTVLVPPGQNSFSSDSLKKASLPVKISPVQLEALYRNQDFKEKSAENLNLKSAEETAGLKPTLKVAEQKAPAEGLYNAKTGDFAPKSGGFIDLATGLYVAPDKDAKLDEKSGVYVAKKTGEIDADTGQYVAPKGLILDAKKGFVLEGDAEKKPELLALKEDLNKDIAKDIVVGGEALFQEPPFNINEKFIRDRIVLSVWGLHQSINSNGNSNGMNHMGIDSKSSVRFGLDWQMSTNNRFSPTVGVDYSILDFGGKMGINQTSKKLFSLRFGTLYALSKNVNLYANIGLHQDHYLDQVINTGGFFSSFELKKIVTTRISAGANAEFWRSRKWSLDASLGGVFIFRKRINNFVTEPGGGIAFEVLPKYNIADNKWIGLGLSVENLHQNVSGNGGRSSMDRKSDGLELKYISDF